MSADEVWAARAAESASALHRARMAAGLTQSQLAERAGLTRNHVQLLETGSLGARWNPRLDSLYALAAALGVSVVDLLPADARAVVRY